MERAQYGIGSDELTEQQFRMVSEIVYRFCGIHLKEGKESLVRARLMKRLRALGISSFETYLQLIEGPSGQDELRQMIDVMTTNKTSFFRESAHFDFLVEHVLPDLRKESLRFWSAACSTGEEPYTLAMILLEHLPGCSTKDVKILATDISRPVMAKAAAGRYGEKSVLDIPASYLQKYFSVQQSSEGRVYQIKPVVRSLARFACLNLLEPWPMKGPFQVIFCRNVMIYFDRQTQERMVQRFYDLIEPGGYLFVGHSEGLSGVRHGFTYVRPAVYRKNGVSATGWSAGRMGRRP
ncbi:CheR family methyltransferase [Desulfatirhabdium butyrativorans]|uniref:CheR family methyltransferase n=1 Tax=Desulfatirhabdium butyrativorans TaxID=340467 RepID=UPI00041196B3|nr:protein-glutamate O-methyltransferase CheR [Desulfatirhabdium butyrativorans]